MLDIFAASYSTLLVLLLFRFVLRRWRSPSIALLPGPTSNSWLVGVCHVRLTLIIITVDDKFT